MAFHLYGCPRAYRGEFVALGDKTGSTLESVCFKNIAEGRKLNVNIHAFSCRTVMNG
jgi:hypothetical protein